MEITKIITQFIISSLNQYSQSLVAPTRCEVITFFDKQYPRVLLPYCYYVPVIFYCGNIECLSNMDAIMITHSPSYYAQKIIRGIRKANNVICLKSNANSITKCTTLCDIIYCNDIYDLHKHQTMLTFSIGRPLANKYQIQLIGQLITTLYVVEGYPNVSSFDFVAQSIDNQVEIIAVPTNIYLSGSKLPNILLSQGITPLLVN